MALIECDNLEIGWPSSSVVKKINLKVEKGDYLFITGENGSGKSTFVQTLLGLIPALSGRVIFSDGLKKNQIGYLPQKKEFQMNFPASVQEVVLSGCQNDLSFFPFYKKSHKELVKKNLEMLGILQLRKKSFYELSGGQQQRVLLARALCTAKSLLILDEPVTGLDADSTLEMYDILYSLNKNIGMTIIMISHDLSLAQKYASKIYNMNF